MITDTAVQVECAEHGHRLELSGPVVTRRESHHTPDHHYSSLGKHERRALAGHGQALDDGSYPIPDVSHLHSAAVLAASHHGDWQAAQRLVRKRAKELHVDLSTLPGFTHEQPTSGQHSDHALRTTAPTRDGMLALAGEVLDMSDPLGSPKLTSQADRTRLDEVWAELAQVTGISATRLRETGRKRAGLDGNADFPTYNAEAIALGALASRAAEDGSILPVLAESGNATSAELAGVQPADSFDEDFAAYEKAQAAQEVAAIAGRNADGFSGPAGRAWIDPEKASAAMVTMSQPAAPDRPEIALSATQAMDVERLSRLDLSGRTGVQSAVRDLVALTGQPLSSDWSTDGTADSLALTDSSTDWEIDRLGHVSRSLRLANGRTLVHDDGDPDGQDHPSVDHNAEIKRLAALCRSMGLVDDNGNREGRSAPPGAPGQKTRDAYGPPRTPPHSVPLLNRPPRSGVSWGDGSGGAMGGDASDGSAG